MRDRLCRTQEGLLIKPGEGAVIEQPLVGCFIAVAWYSSCAALTHCGPADNDLACRYHRDLRPDSLVPNRLIVLSLDLSTTTHWQRRRDEYESSREELVALLVASLHLDSAFIEREVYTANADVTVAMSDEGKLEVSSERRRADSGRG